MQHTGMGICLLFVFEIATLIISLNINTGMGMDRIKKITKVALASMVLFTALPAVASSNCGICLNEPYLGLELLQTNMDFKTGYGKGVFYKKPVDWNVFGGFKFSRNFGLEGGYESTPKKGRQARLESSQMLPGGVSQSPGEFTSMESSVRVSHPYAGFFGQCNWRCMAIQALVGASITHLKARTAILDTETGTLNQAAYDNSVRTYSKTKIVPMFKLAGVYNFNNCFAARVSFLYRNTGSISAVAKQSGADTIKLRNTVGVGMAFIYYFR